MSDLLDTEAAAAYLGLSPLTMSRWRCQLLGPSYVKFGNRVKYARADLEEYVERCKIVVPAGRQ
jgi:hypothetical protein